MAERKDILNAILKALLAGVETSAFGKTLFTFISELAALPKEKRRALDASLPDKQFEELLSQSELSTTNAALAAAGTEQIKKLISNLIKLSNEQINALTEITQNEFNSILNKLDGIDKTTKEIRTGVKELKVILGRNEDKIAQLEELLKQQQISSVSSPQQKIPQVSQETKDIAARINDDAGPYALALKAIAEGNPKKADKLLDKTQQFLDAVQEKKDDAQIKIYTARMQNASYAGKLRDALQYCDKIVSLTGDDSSVLSEVAAIYYQNAEYHKAEPLMTRALKIDEAAFGKDHPDVATDLNNLAQLYKSTNRLKEAEPLMTRALKIDEAAFGKDHPDVAIDLNNLALLYKDTNRLKEAEPLMTRALKIDEAAFGKVHPNVAIRLNNLAQLYKATNRLKEAEPLVTRALKIDEAAFGKDHPDVATDLNNLAQLYQATNRLKEAEPIARRTVEILLQFTRRTGHQHPHLMTVIENYAGLLIQMGLSKEQVNAKLKSLAPDLPKLFEYE
ncbi:MAG: tetratricopeptide repeat protein [Sedimentisphaerales bacterium]|nr:tetratricopeptide repeat protein [Sedimentisphaerales bacterium]